MKWGCRGHCSHWGRWGCWGHWGHLGSQCQGNHSKCKCKQSLSPKIIAPSAQLSDIFLRWPRSLPSQPQSQCSPKIVIVGMACSLKVLSTGTCKPRQGLSVTKYRFRFRKIWFRKKSLGFGFGKSWSRKKVSVSVSENLVSEKKKSK